MKILVTGGDGFIGSHLVEMLAENGHEVISAERFATQPRGWLDTVGLHANIRRVRFDATEPCSCPFNLFDCDAVFHLAARGDVPISKHLPDVYSRVNIDGTRTIARISANHCARLILMSTSEVYGGNDETITEETPLHPRSIYAATKIAAEAMVTASRHMYGLNATIVRGFNTYGPRQSRRGVIAELIAQYLDPAVEEIRIGNTEAARDFVYVEDMCRALVSLLDTDDPGPLNIAGGKAIKIGTLASRIADLTGYDKPRVPDESRLREGYEVDILCGDAGKLHALTGWEPEITLNEGLRRTIQWWKEQGR